MTDVGAAAAVEDQPARTSLAWSRSLLGCVVVGLLLARGAALAGATGGLVVVPLVLAAGGVAVAYVRQRQLRGPRPAPARRSVPAFTVAVVGLVVIAAALAARSLVAGL